MVAAVIEDSLPGRSPRVVGFGADVFVTDTFMKEARTGCEPHLTYRVVSRELSEKISPVLRRDAIARSNAGEGLSVIVINVGTTRTLSEQSADYALRYHVREAFIWSHLGYLIKEVYRRCGTKPIANGQRHTG